MSRSPTPKRIVSITGTSPEANVSHSTFHAHSSLASTSSNRRLPSEPPSTSSPSNIPIETMARATRQRPAEELPSDQPLSKKVRRYSDDEKSKVHPRSSPSSSSQGMLESEIDVDRSQQSEPSVQPPVPPKKKRTRTLTTPHQSAVLHALLAQSRFPTTAMREEVGRSIGLSARKVQIWFQNQRQKARRPGNQSQSSALLTRPAQYGSFPSLQSSPLAITDRPVTSEDRGVGSSTRPLNAASPLNSEEPPPKRRRYDLSETPIDRGSQLLGPGMPGSDVPTSPFRGRDLPLPTRRSSDLGPHYYASSDHPHTGLPKESFPPSVYTIPRPASAHTSRGISRQRSFSRTLPPLVFDGHRPHSSYSAPGQGGLYHLSSSAPVRPSSTLFSVGVKNTPSPESPFAHQIPEPPHLLSSPYSHSPPPPPAHLRAYPPSHLSSPLHSGPTSWSGHSSFTHPSPPTHVSSPLTLHRQPTPQQPPRSASLSPIRVLTPAPQLGEPLAESSVAPRLGRYDPVRAAFIPVRQPTPPQSGSTPPVSQSAETENRSFESGTSHDKHDE